MINDNKMRHRFTFIDVLNNHDDQVIVRRLLAELVPEDVQNAIIVRFNQHVEQYNFRREQQLKVEELR